MTPFQTIDRPDAIDDVGTVPAAAVGVTAQECGSGPLRQTVFTFTNVPLTITDANAYASLKIYDFPAGVIDAQAQGAFTLTTTSTIASTLNSGVTVSFGLGSAAASSATLATTMIDCMPGTGQTVPTTTASTTINVAGATGRSRFIGAGTAGCASILDGQATAKDLYFNVAVPTGTDIDADATVLINGTFTVTWKNLGVA